MSYRVDETGYAAKVVYPECAVHSNASLLQTNDPPQEDVGIAHALFAYAIQVSKDWGFGGVIYFKAKTSELREYYGRVFGAVPLGQYDPFRMIIWEDVAEVILSSYENGVT